MKAWKKHRKHYREYWLWALAIRRLSYRSLAYILAKGKKVKFKRNRDVPLKRAMQLVQAAQNKKGGDRNAGEKLH